MKMPEQNGRFPHACHIRVLNPELHFHNWPFGWQVEGGGQDGDRAHFGYDFFNTARFEDTSTAVVASEEAEGEISR